MLSRNLLSTQAPAAVVLIRLMVGAVFLSEGIQKFLIPEQVGAGRFAKIGLPAPEFLAPFVGSFEIVCGALVLAGLLTATWVALLSQYRRVNRSKLAVLKEIEDLLPIRPFRREDAYFEHYLSLSLVEQGIAALFAVVYVVLGVASLVAS